MLKKFTKQTDHLLPTKLQNDAPKRLQGFKNLPPIKQHRFLRAGRLLVGPPAQLAIFGGRKQQYPHYRPRLIFYPVDYRRAFRFSGRHLGRKYYRSKRTFGFASFGSFAPKYWHRMFQPLTRRWFRIKNRPGFMLSAHFRRNLTKLGRFAAKRIRQRARFFPKNFTLPQFKFTGSTYYSLTEYQYGARLNSPKPMSFFYGLAAPPFLKYRMHHFSGYFQKMTLQGGYNKNRNNKFWFRSRGQRTCNKRTRAFNRHRFNPAKGYVRGKNNAFGSALIGHAPWRSRGAPRFSPADRSGIKRYARFGHWIGHADYEYRWKYTRMWFFMHPEIYLAYGDNGFFSEWIYTRYGHRRYAQFRLRSWRLIFREFATPKRPEFALNRRFGRLYYDKLSKFFCRNISLLMKYQRNPTVQGVYTTTRQIGGRDVWGTLLVAFGLWVLKKLRWVLGAASPFPLVYSSAFFFNRKKPRRLFMAERSSSAYASLFGLSRNVGGSYSRAHDTRAGLSTFESLNILRVNYFNWGGYKFGSLPTIFETDNVLFPHSNERPRSFRYLARDRRYYQHTNYTYFEKPDLFVPNSVFDYVDQSYINVAPAFSQFSSAGDAESLIMGSHLTYQADLRAEREFREQSLWDTGSDFTSEYGFSTLEASTQSVMSDVWERPTTFVDYFGEEGTKSDAYRGGLELLERFEDYIADDYSIDVDAHDDELDTNYDLGHPMDIRWLQDLNAFEGRFWGFPEHVTTRVHGELPMLSETRIPLIHDVAFIDVGGPLSSEMHLLSAPGSVLLAQHVGQGLQPIFESVSSWLNLATVLDTVNTPAKEHTVHLVRGLWDSLAGSGFNLVVSGISLRVAVFEGRIYSTPARICDRLSITPPVDCFADLLVGYTPPVRHVCNNTAAGSVLNLISSPYTRLDSLETSLKELVSLSPLYDTRARIHFPNGVVDRGKLYTQVEEEFVEYLGSGRSSLDLGLDGLAATTKPSLFLALPQVSAFFVPQLAPVSGFAVQSANRTVSAEMSGSLDTYLGSVVFPGRITENDPTYAFKTHGTALSQVYKTLSVDDQFVTAAPNRTASVRVSNMRNLSTYSGALRSALFFNFSSMLSTGSHVSRSVLGAADRIVSLTDLRTLRQQLRLVMYQLPHYRAVNRSFTRYRFLVRRARRYGFGSYAGRLVILALSAFLAADADYEEEVDHTNAYYPPGWAQSYSGNSLMGPVQGIASNNYSEFWWWGGPLFSWFKEMYSVPRFNFMLPRRYYSHIGRGLWGKKSEHLVYENRSDFAAYARRLWYRVHFRRAWMKPRYYFIIDYFGRAYVHPRAWFWSKWPYPVRFWQMGARPVDRLRYGYKRSHVFAIITWLCKMPAYCFINMISKPNIWFIAYDFKNSVQDPFGRKQQSRRLFQGFLKMFFLTPGYKATRRRVRRRYAKNLAFFGSVFGILRRFRRSWLQRFSVESWIPTNGGSRVYNLVLFFGRFLWPRWLARDLWGGTLGKYINKYAEHYKALHRRYYLYYLNTFRFFEFRLINMCTLLWMVFSAFLDFVWHCIRVVGRGVCRILYKRFVAGRVRKPTLHRRILFVLPWYWRWFRKHYFLRPFTAVRVLWDRYFAFYLYSKFMQLFYSWGGNYSVWRDPRHTVVKRLGLYVWLRVIGFGPLRGLRYLYFNGYSIISLMWAEVFNWFITPTTWAVVAYLRFYFLHYFVGAISWVLAIMYIFGYGLLVVFHVVGFILAVSILLCSYLL